MKKIIYISVFILGAISCKKEDVNDPVISLIGNNTVDLFMGDTYTELGATATDDKDGDVTSSIEISGTINNAQAGTYYITYTVSDNAGNEATATRAVHIHNHAYLLEGNYLVSDTITSTIPANNDTLNYTVNVFSSSQTDNRIFLQNLHNFGTAVSVYGDVSGTSLTIQPQTPTGMIQSGQIISVSGICTNNAVTRINYTVDYTFNGAGVDDTCSAVLVKQ